MAGAANYLTRTSRSDFLHSDHGIWANMKILDTAPNCHLVKVRIIAYLHSTGNGSTSKSFRALADEINGWADAPYVYRQHFGETPIDLDEKLSVTTRSLETWIKGDAFDFGIRFTKPRPIRFWLICEYLISIGKLRRSELKDNGKFVFPAVIFAETLTGDLDPALHDFANTYASVRWDDHSLVVDSIYSEKTSRKDVYTIVLVRESFGRSEKETKEQQFERAKNSVVKNKSKYHQSTTAWYSGVLMNLYPLIMIVIEPLVDPFLGSEKMIIKDIRDSRSESESVSLLVYGKNSKSPKANNIDLRPDNVKWLICDNLSDKMFDKFDIEESSSAFLNLNIADYQRFLSRVNMTGRLEEDFIQEATSGNISAALAILRNGININYRHPATGFRLIHVVTVLNSAELVDFFLGCPEVDFLVKTPKGHLPSQLAFRSDIIEGVIAREMSQARAQGVNYFELAQSDSTVDQTNSPG